MTSPMAAILAVELKGSPWLRDGIRVSAAGLLSVDGDTDKATRSSHWIGHPELSCDVESVLGFAMRWHNHSSFRMPESRVPEPFGINHYLYASVIAPPPLLFLYKWKIISPTEFVPGPRQK